MNKNKIIQLKAISKEFNGEQVLSEISLDIHDNEFVTLLGPSGCGKTTMLRIIAGFETADSGDVYFDGVFSKLNLDVLYDIDTKKLEFSSLVNGLDLSKMHELSPYLKDADFIFDFLESAIYLLFCFSEAFNNEKINYTVKKGFL